MINNYELMTHTHTYHSVENEDVPKTIQLQKFEHSSKNHPKM
jgi:hypothetical protein